MRIISLHSDSMSVERDEGSQREEDEIDEVGTEAGNNQTKGYKVRGESRYSVWRLTGATGSNDCDDDDDEEEEEEDEEEEEEEKEEEKYDYYWQYLLPPLNLHSLPDSHNEL